MAWTRNDFLTNPRTWAFRSWVDAPLARFRQMTTRTDSSTVTTPSSTELSESSAGTPSSSITTSTEVSDASATPSLGLSSQKKTALGALALAIGGIAAAAAFFFALPVLAVAAIGVTVGLGTLGVTAEIAIRTSRTSENSRVSAVNTLEASLEQLKITNQPVRDELNAVIEAGTNIVEILRSSESNSTPELSVAMSVAMSALAQADSNIAVGHLPATPEDPAHPTDATVKAHQSSDNTNDPVEKNAGGAVPNDVTPAITSDDPKETSITLHLVDSENTNSAHFSDSTKPPVGKTAQGGAVPNDVTLDITSESSPVDPKETSITLHPVDYENKDSAIHFSDITKPPVEKTAQGGATVEMTTDATKTLEDRADTDLFESTENTDDLYLSCRNDSTSDLSNTFATLTSELGQSIARVGPDVADNPPTLLLSPNGVSSATHVAILSPSRSRSRSPSTKK